MERKNNFWDGFGLLEMILAIGLWIVLASSGVAMLLGGLRANRQSDEVSVASNLAGEGLDGLKAIKKQGWITPFLATNCTSGCGLATVSGTWGYSGVNNVIGKFTRQVFVNPVNRDGSGNIVTTGGSVDTDTYLAKSIVTWSPGGLRNNTVSSYTYLTNYARKTVGNWALPLLDSNYNFGGTSDVVGLTVVGNYLYVIRPAPTNDFNVFDITNTASPTLVGSLSIAGAGTTGIVGDGSYVYISDANNSSELKIINITNPTLPVLTSSFDIPGNTNANGLALVGNVIYVVRDFNGSATEFEIIDVTNRSAPVVLGSLNLSGSAKQVFVIGNYAYVADTDNATELQVINITNSSLPVLVGTLDLPGNDDATAITGFDSTILVGRNNGAINIVDVSNPGLPSLISTFVGSGGSVRAISMGNNNTYAFLATTSTTQEFQVVDITSLVSPALLGSMNLASGLDWVVYDFVKDRAFLGSRDNADEIVILKPTP